MEAASGAGLFDVCLGWSESRIESMRYTLPRKFLFAARRIVVASDSSRGSFGRNCGTGKHETGTRTGGGAYIDHGMVDGTPKRNSRGGSMDILEETGVSQDLTEKLRLVFCTFAARFNETATAESRSRSYESGPQSDSSSSVRTAGLGAVSSEGSRVC